MDDRGERRLADREAVFRDVNEGIERGHWQGEGATPAGFRCECARLGCNALIMLTAPEYERVRSYPRRFVMVSGHELPEIETVVERGGDYVIVEKRGAAGRKAEATDPRQ